MVMTADKMNEIRKLVKEKRPIIHGITNPISINQCANVILSVGASPILAEHPLEVAEITEKADVLVLNLGNITEARVQAMAVSGSVAAKKGIPVVLDAVGVACSSLRRNLAEKMIENSCPNVIKGNYSEIKALSEDKYSAVGVDSEPIDEEEMICICGRLSRMHKTVVLASGKKDIVTDGETCVIIENGCSQMAEITGTGCMLGMLCGCFAAVSDGMSGAVTACGVMGICGEMSETKKGNGSFFVDFMDKISTLSDEEIIETMKIEVRTYEEV